MSGLNIFGALWLIVGFIVKHFMCDYVLQSDYQLRHKGQYGHWGGILHAAIHAAGTFLVMAPFGLMAALWAAVLDGIMHYHIDWSKAQLSRHYDLQPKDRGFWILFGADQMAHHLTYLVVVLVAMPVFFVT